MLILRSQLSGLKVYIVAAIAVAFGLYGAVSGEMTTFEAIDYVLGGSGLAAGRATFAKLETLLAPTDSIVNEPPNEREKK